MAKKKIQDENGATYVLKKPWYKRFWVWILIIVLLIAGVNALGGSDDDSSSSSKKSDTTSKSSKRSASVSHKEKVATGKLVTLGTGKFRVGNGKDITPGRYVITVKSGSGNLSDEDGINVVIGASADNEMGQIDSYTATLPKGDKVDISGINNTTFTPVKNRKFKTTLSAGDWTVGTDIKAGHYIITSLQGSGNISTDDADINEILGKSKNSDTGQVTSITTDLTNGQVLSTDLEQIKLTAK